MGSLIGTGVSGSVFEAKRADGKLFAVKVFEVMSSNPLLLANRVARVHESALSGATVPILGQALDVRPPCVVMPQLEGNLQIVWPEYQETKEAWPLVLKLAENLAKLHSARVAHGNLKPGNVFLEEDGNPLLSDYATGLMPDVHRLNYSDALLYAPPEQLRYPEGYLNEAGYRWDVYAFGVLAFRLLNGIFPRCEEFFRDVCPTPGEQRHFEIDFENEKIAIGLEAAHLAGWKHETADESVKRRRHVVEHCLALNPLERPSDMMEVQQRLAKITEDLDHEVHEQEILFREKKSHKGRKVAVFGAQVLGVTALALGGMWAWTQQQRSAETAVAEEDCRVLKEEKDELIQALEDRLSEAKLAEKSARESESASKTALAQEEEKSIASLASAHETNQRLFRWVLEKGIRGLPTLEDRQGRLKILEKSLLVQLSEIQERKGLEKQTAELRLRLAEVILASGLEKEGSEALAEALEKGSDYLSIQELAKAKLRRGLLLSEKGASNLKEVIADAEATSEKAWGSADEELVRAQAALHLMKAREAEGRDDPKLALTEYYESLKLFQKLAWEYPEAPALSYTMGRVYLSAGAVAEGAGALGDAATLRGFAAKRFLKLASSEKDKTPEIEYQIASATAAKAVADWQLGKTFDAERLAKSGLGKLSALALKMPGDFRVIVDLASQQGIIATALRDEGKSTQAATLLRKAIKTVGTGLEQHPDDLKAKYLLASLKWQMCGLFGQEGAVEKEIEIGTSARDLLREILAEQKTVPHPYLVKKSLAYLCGDLGHAADLHGDADMAIEFIREAVGQWEDLIKALPKNSENLEGLQWAKQRLSELEKG